LTVQQALRACGIDPREARLLLAATTGFSQAAVIGFQERELPKAVEESFFDLVSRRKRGEPIAYIVGHKEFYGLELVVNPAVLIPRPETELLVELALQREPSSVLDLGTGSGAMALAIKRNHPDVKVVAVEASAAALVIAKRNAAKHGLEVDFRHGRWFEPVAGQRFELIVANPPYVAEGDPHLKDLVFEPREALLAGADGLDAIREITAAAPGHLEKDGWLLIEHGQGQDGAVRMLLANAGLEEVRTWPDLAGIPRVSGGRR
jgi:release factor glutamine methyltransferase